MLSKRKIWVNGKLIPFNRAQTHILSHSFARGSGLFEVMSVHPTDAGSAVFRLDDHIARLARSAELSRMKLPLKAPALKRAVLETVAANKVKLGLVKLIAYYGEVEFEVVPSNPKVTIAVVAVDVLRDLRSERFDRALRQPAKVTISPWRKPDPKSVPIECKCSANYITGMIAKMDALKAGFTAPVLLDLRGHIAEGATESLFIVKNGVIKTAPLGNVLAGITRKTIIEIADDVDIPLVEKKMLPRELHAADEAFFTSSLAKTWPISQVDKTILPAAPGFTARLLDAILAKITAGKVKKYRKWLTAAK